MKGRATHLDQRARTAMSAMTRRRQNAALDQHAEFGHQSFRPHPQSDVYCHDLTAPRRSVKQCALRHRQAHHLLDAQRLCTELYAIGVVRLRRAALILDRECPLTTTI